jgi:putative membrane protein
MKMKKLSSIMMIALAALAFQACKSVTADDAKFATTAASDGMAEVNAGKMAQNKAVSKRVKEFAAMMVNDHTKAGDELAALAKTKNISLPLTPDADHKKAADDLAAKSGKAFDKAYINAMLDGHKKAVKLFEDASQNCKDPDLKAFATKTLPTLKMHLYSVQAIHDSMK